MCNHGFIGAICMPSELIPAGMPLPTIIRKGGPFWAGVPARYRHPVSDSPPPSALSRWTYSSVMKGTWATTQRRSVIGNWALAASNASISAMKSVWDRECTSARQPAWATRSAAAANAAPVPWAMNSPMPPVRNMSSPKNGNWLRSRSASSGVFGSDSMCRKLIRMRASSSPSRCRARNGRCIV